MFRLRQLIHDSVLYSFAGKLYVYFTWKIRQKQNAVRSKDHRWNFI